VFTNASMLGNCISALGVTSLSESNVAFSPFCSSFSLMSNAAFSLICPLFKLTKTPKVFASFAADRLPQRCMMTLLACSWIGYAIFSYGSAIIVGFPVAKATPIAWNLPPPTNRKTSTSSETDWALPKSHPITCPECLPR